MKVSDLEVGDQIWYDDSGLVRTAGVYIPDIQTGRVSDIRKDLIAIVPLCEWDQDHMMRVRSEQWFLKEHLYLVDREKDV